MRNVVITGAGRGLGMEILKQHRQRGDRVIGVDKEISDELCEMAHGDSYVEAVEMDITQKDSVKDGSSRIGRAIDRIDFIYQNAGVYYFKDEVPFEETDFEAALDMYNINAVGFMRVTQALLPLFAKGTLMCCTASDSASIKLTYDRIYHPGDRYSSYIYNMSKAAMSMAACFFRDQLENRIGGKLMIVHPGWMRTKMGGPNAPVDPQDSARHIVAMATGEEELKNTFVDYLGNPIPW